MRTMDRTGRGGTEVFAIFESWEGLARAMASLRDSDFDDAGISVVAPRVFSEPGTASAGTGRAAPEAALPRPVEEKAIPGGGRIVVAGPITRAVRERTVNPDGMRLVLHRFGLPEYEAEDAAASMFGGHAFVSVRCSNYDRAVEATDLLETAGASSIGATRAPRPWRRP